MKNSLSVKYTLFSIFMIVIVASTFTVVFVLQHSKQLKENLQNEAISDCIVFEASTAEFLATFTMDRIREQIHFLKQKQGIEYIYVLDTTGVVIMDGSFGGSLRFNKLDDTFSEAALKSDKLLIQETDSLLDASLPISFGNRKLGHLRIGYNKLKLNQDINSFIVTSILISTAFIFATALITFLIMRKISKPLNLITAVTQKIAQGEFNTRIEVNTKDELMILANAFNDMSEQLSKTRNSLIKAKTEAEKSNELKSEFLAQISHEIRTPINSLLSFSSLIEDEFNSGTNKELTEYYQIIRNAGKRIIRTVDLILNMSEIQKGTYKPNFTYFNVVEDVLTQLENEFLSLAKEKNISLKLINHSSNPRIYADHYTISQIFQNLIDNAIKYTSVGKVEIIVNDADDFALEIIVKDTGIGISEEFIDYIFDPFRQEQQGYTRKYEGAGLGLALVKNYCEMNKTEISFQSQKGLGTEFRLKFRKNM